MKTLILSSLGLLFLLGLLIYPQFNKQSKQNAGQNGEVKSVINIQTDNTNTGNVIQNEIVGIPVRLLIPNINVDTTIDQVGLDSQGRMDIPKTDETVGWYMLGSKPGETGNAVIDGHLDTPTGAPAIFWSLNTLQPGNTIIVNDSNGKEYKFRVTQVQTYAFDQVPMDKVFGNSTRKQLNLITCGGTWDKAARNYSNRTVVYSEIVE